MPLAGIALATVLVSPLAPHPPRRSSFATTAASARRPRALRRARCSATATASGEAGDTGELSRATLLWRAAKLPIYSVALVPLTVGSACAYHHAGLFFAKRYFLLLAAAVLVITWLNLSQCKLLNCLLFIVRLCAISQCPPFRLSYQGLGEPLCFAAFGPLATTAFYFSNSSINAARMAVLPITKTVVASSVLVGLTTTLILFCSHFHQVRIGTKEGAKIVMIGVVTLYFLLAAFGLSRALPSACIVSY
ncbi:hypothetical protein PR202_gb18846 [Eleusine coracana subsp. coracana]|uniref:Uncharacterized protein n=1 Tax=Eleusine coracana subsp. coracana TaxID=191504 RepID=A0AAV5F790_ELECO|nr:hypothetical protein PR202_gb18846 [Eleusine coracana subsp. coracana]